MSLGLAQFLDVAIKSLDLLTFADSQASSRCLQLTSSRLTPLIEAMRHTTNLGAISSMAAHIDGYSPRYSCAMRTTNSRTYGENLFDDLFIAPFFKRLEPLQFPGLMF